MLDFNKTYTATARTLHWLIAVLIAGQLISGFAIGHELATGETLYQIAQLHKSFGLSVLFLSIIRLIWRLRHTPPKLPSTLSSWERIGSKISHVLFYFVMIAIPLTGWLYVSASPLQIPTKLFFTVPVPHLPVPVDAGLAVRLSGLHEFFAFATIGMLVLHVAAAAKHHLISKDTVMSRMAGYGLGPMLAYLLAILTAGGLIWVFLQPYDESAEAEPLAEVAQAAPAAPAASESGAPAQPFTWQIMPEETGLEVEVFAKEAPRTATIDDISGLIRLDPEDPEAIGEIDVVINTRTLSSSENMVKQLASDSNWLNIARFPEAFYKADTITRQDDGSYLAEGELTIRDVTLPLDLPFTLTLDGDQAIADASVTFDRADYDLGELETDNTEVTVTIHVEASRN